jgi:PAS domain S-box-containing protein
VVVGRDITEQQQDKMDLERLGHLMPEGQKIAHLGTWEYLLDTQTTLWSEELYRICGLDPAGPSPNYEALLTKVVHPDDAARLRQIFMTAVQNRAVYELEHRIVRPDGSVRWTYHRGHPYFDKHGRLVRYIGTTMDVTDRRQGEKDLERQHAILTGINRILREALAGETDEQWGKVCLAVAEELTGSKIGFISEINPSGRLDDIAISDLGRSECKLSDSQELVLPKNLHIHGIYGRY